MNDHDLIQLATKYGSWFGNTLELRKEGLVALAKEISQATLRTVRVDIPTSVMEQEFQAHYKRGWNDAMEQTKDDRL